MVAVDFLHQENPPTSDGVESTTFCTEGQRQTNYATQRRFGIGGDRQDDIEELIMGHEDELTTEELQEILNEEHQETQRNVSPSEQEEDERGPMLTSAIKDLLKKWADVRAMVLEWHPNQADVSSRVGDLYNDNAIKMVKGKSSAKVLCGVMILPTPSQRFNKKESGLNKAAETVATVSRQIAAKEAKDVSGHSVIPVAIDST
ncbi:uncharacterized protein TNCV_3002311 [Trichonephila clavipes]|nr:uncharacterized protein TNCV_3002311 [Trichonephila clavipes]